VEVLEALGNRFDKASKAIAILSIIALLAGFGVTFAVGCKVIATEAMKVWEGYERYKHIEEAPSPIAFKPLKEFKEQDVVRMVEMFQTMNPKMSTWMAVNLTEAVLDACERFGLEPWVVVEIIRHESHGNIFAKNSYTTDKKHYVYGVMQVSDVHADMLKKSGIIKRFPQDLYTPRGGVFAGCFVLHQLMRAENGDLEAALQRYSGGARYVEKITNAWR
jgi:hypothetical protein